MPSTKLRSYQSRIVAATGSKNAIIVLPTGSGKTLIASAIVERTIASRGTSHTASGASAKIALFVVPTRDLVRQQSTYLEREIPGSRVLAYASDDFELGLKKFLHKHDPSRADVLVTTPMALHTTMTRSGSPLVWSQVDLLVLDECHHSAKRHPYKKLASLWRAEAAAKRCQLVGLTASCSYKLTEAAQRKDIDALCERLCTETILDATPAEMRAGGYHAAEAKVSVDTAPSHISIEPESYPYASVVVDKKTTLRDSFLKAIAGGIGTDFTRGVVSLTRKMEAIVKKRVPEFGSPVDKKGKKGKLKAWGKFCENFAKSARDAEVKEMLEYLRHWYEALRLLVIAFPSPPTPKPIPTDEIAFLYLQMSIGRMPNPFTSLRQEVETSLDQWQEHFLGEDSASGRLQRLTDILEAQRRSFGPSVKIIIFAQYQISTHVLKYFLQHEAALRTWARPVCIHSANSSGVSMSPTDMKRSLASFRTDAANVLVATSVAEEGMDIAACNVVVRFDPIQTAVSLVQSRGRARQADCAFVVMEEAPNKSVEALRAAEKAQKDVVRQRAQEEAPNKSVEALRAAEKVQKEVVRKRAQEEAPNKSQALRAAEKAQKEVVRQRASGSVVEKGASNKSVGALHAVEKAQKGVLRQHVAGNVGASSSGRKNRAVGKPQFPQDDRKRTARRKVRKEKRNDENAVKRLLKPERVDDKSFSKPHPSRGSKIGKDRIRGNAKTSPKSASVDESKSFRSRASCSSKGGGGAHVKKEHIKLSKNAKSPKLERVDKPDLKLHHEAHAEIGDETKLGTGRAQLAPTSSQTANVEDVDARSTPPELTSLHKLKNLAHKSGTRLEEKTKKVKKGGDWSCTMTFGETVSCGVHATKKGARQAAAMLMLANLRQQI